MTTFIKRKIIKSNGQMNIDNSNWSFSIKETDFISKYEKDFMLICQHAQNERTDFC